MRKKIKLLSINIEERIIYLQGKAVILDIDLAEIYATKTMVLNQAVKRNSDRFPDDFLVKLTIAEKEKIIEAHPRLEKLKYSHKTPFAFTEYGALMVANILRSDVATRTSIFIVRSFIKLRKIIASNRDLAQKISDLEMRIDSHDETILSILKSIKEMTTLPLPQKRKRIGINVDRD